MSEDIGKVVQVLNVKHPMEVVVNRGKEHAVYDGQTVVVFAVGKEVVDPDTHENLGPLEVLRGRGEVVHTQPKMCTVRSTETRRLPQDRLRKRLPGMMNQLSAIVEPYEYVTDPVETPVPFEGVTLGDSVRFD